MIKSWPWVLAIGIAWIIFVPICLMVPMAWEQGQKTEKTTALTQGKVTAYDPSIHATATYEYFVGGTRYECSQAGMSDYPVGSSVPIYYDPKNPSVNYAIRVPPSFNYNLIGIGVLVMITLLAVLLAAFGGRRIGSKSTRTRPPLVH